jgi:4-hydroxybenzoate polyprenyltransferase
MKSQSKSFPLFVDLDGTLIQTDLLIESFLRFIKVNPLRVVEVFIWLFQGRAFLKSQLAKRVELDAALLPYNLEFLDYLKQQKENGRKLYLLTASHEIYANQVAKHVGIFDGVIASKDSINMKGETKLEYCKSINPEFAYAGNDAVDFKIFPYAKESLLVNPSFSAKQKAKLNPVTRVFDTSNNMLGNILRGLRVHQWLKNILIFVPLLVSGLYMDGAAIFDSFVAFFLFSLLASATYVLNDLNDLDADRAHPRKKFRPIASGDWPIANAITFSVGLFVIVFILTLYFTPLNFQLSILAYLLLTLTYSLYLKDYVIADVISLACLFTIRIIAGAMAIDVVLSFWLLAFSMFIFFSLALVKRCAELKVLTNMNKSKASGRDYFVEDYTLMQTFGVTSAFVALLIMAFYVQVSLDDVFYKTPILLWATLPAFAYWLCRMWLKTNRGDMHDDPIVFSLKDRGSLVTIGFIITTTLAAKLV